MENSLKDFLNVVSPSLSEKIIDLNSLAQISNVARLLPNIPIISDAGFECNLTSNGSSADILVAFTQLNRHLIIDSFKSLSSLTSNSKLWERINEFIRRWSLKESLAYDRIENFWLEFDIDGNRPDVPEPSIFFAPHFSEPTSSKSTIDFTKYNWMIKEVLELLMGESITSNTKKSLLQCINSLPINSKIFQVGIMLPRISESKAIRLCIKDIKPSDVTKYLQSIGWNYPIQELDSLLAELSIFVDHIAINIAVENGVHSKIGIECYIDKQPQFASSWKEFFDFMIKKELCTVDKAMNLLKWPGHIEEKSCLQTWPSNLSQAAKLVHPNLRSAAARTINHVKIVYQPMVPLQAKIYLWFGHLWIDTNGLLQK